jgi:hypothetical protein
MAEWIDDSITLKGKEIPLRVGYLQQAKLNFYPENPRIFSVVSSWDHEPTQEEIFRTLSGKEHVKQLIQSIKANGGLTDPIFVQDGTWLVLEGNSRLAAYRALAQKEGLKWGMIKCKLLPKDLENENIFALLGEYHIVGKKDWQPYEQAGYLYRRVKLYKADPREIHQDIGLSVRTINLLIEVYDFMVGNKDNNPSRWSFYYEYIKSRKLKKCREQHPEMDEIIVKKIKSREIPRAVDVRDDLPKIAVIGSRVLKDFLCGKKNFEDSVSTAKANGADDGCYRKLNKFRQWLADKETKEEIATASRTVKKKIGYELSRIKAAIKSLEKNVSNDQ